MLKHITSISNYRHRRVSGTLSARARSVSESTKRDLRSKPKKLEFFMLINLSQLSAKILEGKTSDDVQRNWQLNWAAVFSKAIELEIEKT